MAQGRHLHNPNFEETQLDRTERMLSLALINQGHIMRALATMCNSQVSILLLNQSDLTEKAVTEVVEGLK